MRYKPPCNRWKSTRKLSDALALYLKEHNNGDDFDFVQRHTSLVNRAIALIGDKDIQDWTREDAMGVRDMFFLGLKGERRLFTATVRGYIKSLSPIFNSALTVWQLNYKNPFARLKIKNEGLDAKERLPFTTLNWKTY